LCSTIIDHIQKHCQSSPGARLAYYYFDFSDLEKLKVSTLLRSLIVQLCHVLQDLPEDLEDLYKECNQGRSNPSEETLVEILFRLLDSASQTYIVIDGLDECPSNSETSERSRFHELVVSNIGQLPGQYNFLFTSRKEHDINEAMKALADQCTLQEVPIDIKKVDADVRMHVRRFISEHKRIKTWSEPVRKEIEGELVKGSKGMFRWVDCQLQSLGRCIIPGSARKLLKQLPKTLYETYDRMLDSIPEENQDAVRSVLIFMAYSVRSMTIEELADAALINVDEDYFSPDERSEDPLSVILGLCSSLVTITNKTLSSGDRWQFLRTRRGYSGPIAQFSHYSVKEYLTLDRNKENCLYPIHFNEVQAHHHIAEASLVYIFNYSSGKLLDSSIQWRYTGLSMYAAESWPVHYNMIPISQRKSQLIQKVQRIYNIDEPTPYMNWLNAFRQDYSEDGYPAPWNHGSNIAQFAPPLYIAALNGDFETCKWLLSKGARIDDPNGICTLGDPLQAAAIGGHLSIVRLFLEHGAQVNTKDCGHFGDPLQAASFGGHEEVVKLLIQKGASTQTEHGTFGTPLIAAAQNGHFSVGKILLDAGVDPEIEHRKHGKAIAGAASSGHVGFVSLLLTQGKDINDTNGSEGSALYKASEKGDSKIVSLLLKAGADPNLVSGPCHTPLQIACHREHLEVVKLLIKSGADVDITGGEYGTALQASLETDNYGETDEDKNDFQIFQLLLLSGADINKEGGKYKNPLKCAISLAKVKAAEMLLDKGAIFDDDAFVLAVELMRHSLIGRMLAKGVNVNAQNEDGTALQHAVKNGDIKTIEELFRYDDLDVNARGKEGATALEFALVQGEEQIALDLLARGAAVNDECGEHHKPLTAALSGGNKTLIMTMIDRADLNGHVGGWYYSPLVIAAMKGMNDIIDKLLDLGADIDELVSRGDNKKSKLLSHQL
jgi:ankyrin repeat protein